MTSLNRAGPPITPTTPRAPTPRSRPELGTGRLGVISSYFQLSGIGAAITTLPLAVATFLPRALPSVPGRPVVPLIGCALLAFGFFRTSHLLDQRRRSGAQLATLCFLATLGGFFTKSLGWTALLDLGASAVGLLLVASVWRHLDKD